MGIPKKNNPKIVDSVELNELLEFGHLEPLSPLSSICGYNHC